MLTIVLSTISCICLHKKHLGGIGWDDYLDPLIHRDISIFERKLLLLRAELLCTNWHYRCFSLGERVEMPLWINQFVDFEPQTQIRLFISLGITESLGKLILNSCRSSGLLYQ